MPVERLGGKNPSVQLILLLILAISCLGLFGPAALAHIASSSQSHKSHHSTAVSSASTSHSGTRRHHYRQNLTDKSASRHTKYPAVEKTKETIQPNYEAEVAPMSQIYRLRDLANNEELGGDFGLALKHFKEATEMLGSFSGSHGPTDVLAFYAMGRTAEAAGQLETAKHAYMEALNHDNRFVDIHLRLASLLAKTGQTKQAMSEAKTACEIDPNDPRGHFMLGLLLEHCGQLSEAKQERDKAHNLLGAYPIKAKELQVQNPTSEDKVDAESQDKDSSDKDMPDADMPEGLP